MPLPDVIAQEIVDNLQAALEQSRLIARDLNSVDAEGQGLKPAPTKGFRVVA